MPHAHIPETAPPRPPARSANAIIQAAVDDLNIFFARRSQLDLPRDAAEVRRLSAPAFEQARQGLDALARLNRQQKREAIQRRIPAFLEQQRTYAANGMVRTQEILPRRRALDRDMAQVAALRLGLPGQKAAWERFKQGLEEDIASLEPYVEALRQTQQNYSSQAVLKVIPQAENYLELARLGLAQATAFSLSASRTQVMTGMEMLERAIYANVPFLQPLPIAGRSAVSIESTCGIGILGRQDYIDLSMRLESQAQRNIAGIMDSLPPGQDLTESPEGYAALELAESVALFRSRHEAVLQVEASREPSAGSAEERPAAAVADGPPRRGGRTRAAASQRPAAGAARRAPGPTAGSARTSGAGPSVTTPQLSPHAEAVIELARDRLREFPAPPVRPARARLDFAALGAALRKDARPINEAIAGGMDPLALTARMRSALVDWLGEPDVWAARGEQLQSLPATEVDAGVASLREQVGARIRGVGALHDQLRTEERDLIKRYAFPLASHLSRLFELDEAVLREAPRRLPSEGDTGDGRGRLFEVRVDLSPLSDGRAADPLFVHFHTRKPVAPEALRTIRHADLDAVHIKTAAQVGWGANWERLNGALLGPVHRGPLSARVLAQLQARMATP
ncbi:hypothetical protein C8246_12125 [Paracidovorax avenae]|nr:hypothetical protein C8234_01505 [Paracidovorax avenae]AVS92406.1 hypothetical protein C8246_12125 [Paracidovorax avenae]